MALLCAGVPQARLALFANPQLRSRLMALELEHWGGGPDLAALDAMLVQSMPLRQPPPVDTAELRRLLVDRSGGITQSICFALRRTADAAVKNGREFIDLPDLYEGAIWRGLGLPTQTSARLSPAAWPKPHADIARCGACRLPRLHPPTSPCVLDRQDCIAIRHLAQSAGDARGKRL